MTNVDDSFILRDLGQNDLGKLIELNKEIFAFELEKCESTSNMKFSESESGVRYFENAINKKEGFWGFGAAAEGDLVGYVILKQVPESDLEHRVGISQVQLHTISVTSRLRNKGVGRLLIEKAIESAREKKANRMKVTAYANNVRAINLYRSLGFFDLELTLERVL